MEKFISEFKGYILKNYSKELTKNYSIELYKFLNWQKRIKKGQLDFSIFNEVRLFEYRNHLISQNQSPSSVNRAIKALISFSHWAKQQGHAIHNKIETIEFIPLPDKFPRYLESREQLSILRTVEKAKNHRDIAIFTLLIKTDINYFQLCSLTIENIFLHKRTGYIGVHCAQKGSIRELALDAQTIKALNNWLKYRGMNSGALFNENGRPLNICSMEYLIEKYSCSAKVDSISAVNTFAKQIR